MLKSETNKIEDFFLKSEKLSKLVRKLEKEMIKQGIVKYTDFITNTVIEIDKKNFNQ